MGFVNRDGTGRRLGWEFGKGGWVERSAGPGCGCPREGGEEGTGGAGVVCVGCSVEVGGER